MVAMVAGRKGSGEGERAVGCASNWLEEQDREEEAVDREGLLGWGG